MANNNQLLADYVIGLADDALILGHRLSEWCSKAPFLEEDLAISNVALDFLGRAQMFYDYASDLDSENRSVDQIVFLRGIREYKNTLIHELPIGDFANTMTRQFFIDAFNVEYLDALTQSADTQLAAIAAKAIKESRYHLRRSREWVIRLGDGTEESHQRMLDALDQLWDYTPELFTMTDNETALLKDGIAVDKALLLDAWESEITSTLSEATIPMPEQSTGISGGRDGIHTDHMGYLLTELQYLQRTYPGCEW